jgi:hypothetical protein
MREFEVHSKYDAGGYETHFIVRAPAPKLLGLPLGALAASNAAIFLAMALSKASSAAMIIAGIVALLALAASLGAVSDECITVIRDVGVLLQTRWRTGRVSQKFIDVHRVRSVIINEGLSSADVQYYLAFLVLNSDRMAVAFPNLLPPLRIIQPIYRDVHALLTGQPFGDSVGETHD